MANLNRGAQLIIPRKAVLPGHEERRLRCKCGNMSFSVLVQPKPPEYEIATTTAVVCTRCNQVSRILDDATLARTGKRDELSKRHAALVQQGKKLDADDA